MYKAFNSTSSASLSPFGNPQRMFIYASGFLRALASHPLDKARGLSLSRDETLPFDVHAGIGCPGFRVSARNDEMCFPWS